MAQLKDKDGINFNPNTTAELVAYDTTTNVKEKIEQIEQVSGGVAKPNLFDADDIQNGKGVIYYQAGAILSNSHYSCVFIPLAFDTYYCFAGQDEIIQSYEGTTTAFNLPHRCIYTTERNLALGVNGFDEFADLEIFFEQGSRLNKIYATDQMGAMVIDSNMIVTAY